MKNGRAKIATAATVMGLGALGGVALGTNHGVPSAGSQASSGAAPLVTSASGAATAPNQVVAGRNESGRPPIVTRASGSGAGGLIDD